MTASLVCHCLAPLLLALSVIWAAGLMSGGRRSLAQATALALALAYGLAGLDGMGARLLAPALAGKEWLVEAPLAAIVALWTGRRRRPCWEAPSGPAPAGARRVWGLVLLAALAVATWAFLCAVLDMLHLHPHGTNSDAYAMWNVKARFLYRGGESWTRLFDPELANNRYPLLHPALVARLWDALRLETPAVPQALVVTCVVLCLGLLVSSLYVLRGWITAALAGLAMISLPFFLANAAHQCADLPLSVFALGALTCLVIGRERVALEPAALALAGAFASFASWTKVEGMVLVLALLATAALTGGGGIGGRARRVLWVAAGAAPALGLLAYMNSVFLRVPSEYIQPAPIMLSRALTWHRHAQILAAALRFAVAWPQSATLKLLALAGLTSALARSVQGRAARRAVLVVLVLVAAGFYAVYLTTPWELQWQLDTSLDRLFIQYWPALVLLTFVGGLDFKRDDSVRSGCNA